MIHEYRDCPMFTAYPNKELCRAARFTGSICICDALIDTDFDYDCPFYKTKAQYYKDEMRTIGREKPYFSKRPKKMIIKPHMAGNSSN